MFSGSSVVPKRKSTYNSLAPRKRLKSAPADATSSTNRAIQSAPELSGLLRGQRPIHEIKQEINMQNRMLKEGSALYSDLKAQLAAKASSHQALVGSLNATSADIKAQLAVKAATQQALAASLAGTSYLNSVRQVSANTLTPASSYGDQKESMLSKQLQSSTENSLPSLASTLTSLHNALRTGGYKPSVHISSAASMSSQIQHLLTSVSRASDSSQSKAQKALPTLLSSLKSPVISSPGSILDSASSNQSVSSESSNSPSYSTTTQTENEKLQAIQKLQFHDFPLTTASLIKFPNASAVTQAKLFGPPNVNKIQTHTESSKTSTIQIVSNKGSQVESAGTMTIDTEELSPPRPSRPAIVSTVTEGNIVTVSLTSDKSIIHSAPSTTKTQVTGSAITKSMVSTSVETLGKVNSLLESSPVIQRTNIVTPSSSQVGSNTTTKSYDITLKKTSATVTATHSGSVSSRSSKSTSTAVTSYTATPKPSLSTIAATRTRRIRTPKQYDL